MMKKYFSSMLRAQKSCSGGLDSQSVFLVVAVFLSLAPLTAHSLDLTDYLNQSTVTASSDQFETNLSNNTDTVQIVPNAEIVIVKQIVNDSGGTLDLADFSISTSAGSLTFDAGSSLDFTKTYTSETLYVPPGTYTLQETNIDGYAEGSWSCTVGTVGDSSFDSGSVTLAFGEQTVCTIINDDIAPKLTLAKTLINDDGGDLEIANFEISIDDVIVTDGAVNTVMANTDIKIDELSRPGYTQGTWECVDDELLTSGLPDDGAATGVTFQLAPGADVTCSIVNNDIAPLLTLVKIVTNNNGGTLGVDDFEISINDVVVESEDPQTVRANTDIKISELDLVPYAEGTWFCEDENNLTSGLPQTGAATGEIFQLKQGSDVTCTITNDDMGIDLSIAKAVDDSTPDIGQTITFTLTVVNNGPDVATNTTISDVIPAGFEYVSNSLTGGDGSDDSDPDGTGLSWTLDTMPVGSPVALTFQALVKAP